MANSTQSTDRMDPLLNLLNQRPREDWQWKFEPDAGRHSKVNAVALCNMALLTYSDQAGARHFLIDRWQFADVRFLRGFQTQGIVARRDNVLIVAFRGTEPINAVDWLSDVSYHQRPLSSGVPGLVHGGFARALGEVLQPMLAALEELDRGKPRLFLTGHSLGGALAVLAAAVLAFERSHDVTAVYTYGQPRVGDPDFSTAFNQKLEALTFRYVNDFDIVPHVPPAQLPGRPELPLGQLANLLGTIDRALPDVQKALGKVVQGERFSHVGQLMLFLRDGTLTSDDKLWRDREVLFSGTLKEFLSGLPALLQAKLGQLLHEQDRILDHDPVRGYLRMLEARLD